jgi:urea transport system permease protein
VFKSKDANVLETLLAAIQKETVPAIRKALLEAHAAVILFKPDASEAA